MTDTIMHAYKAVERAMESYNTALLDHLTAMHSSEKSDAGKIERLSQGAKAMRDSSAIYLTYAKFIAYGMPESEDMIGDDLQG
ncbi:MAG: hypothetical protein ACREI9_06590 [Nitrospiraceae bacterium]